MFGISQLHWPWAETAFKKSTDAIIGPFECGFRHTHDPKIGPDATYHSHKLAVRLNFRSDNDEGISIVLNKHTEALLKKILDDFFDRDDFTGTTIEGAGQQLIEVIKAEMPTIRDEYNQHAFHLQDVRIGIDYDGSLDHPKQHVDFTIS
ncbi:hypothetical protein N9Z27_01260 [Alphaproteobacteria bacterium]|nr:hypothetical protein [Alphaproteobacteria bacterium]